MPVQDGGFRQIHYLGNKSRLLDDVERAVDDVALGGGSVVDLFSGTGVVARRLANKRSVKAVDVQEYARVLASALLVPIVPPPALRRAVVAGALTSLDDRLAGRLGDLVAHEERAHADSSPEPICALLEHGSLAARGETIEGILTRYYGGVYFSYKQAAELDVLADQVRRLPAAQVDTGLAALLGAASDVVSSVGNHFAQPMRIRDKNGTPKASYVASVKRLRKASAIDIFASRWEKLATLQPAPYSGVAVRADCKQLYGSLPPGTAAVYADPPYTRDHYSRFYHVLETLVLGDDPGLTEVRSRGDRRPSRGLYRVDRHQSPFCIASQAPAAFGAMFYGINRQRVPLVLSYSPGPSGGGRPRVLCLEALVSLAQQHFRDVRVRNVSWYSHSKFNAQRMNAHVSYEAEALILASP